jgi:hypothetical protein
MHALGRAQQQFAALRIRLGDLVERPAVGQLPPLAVRRRRAPLDFLNLNAPRRSIHVEKDAIRTDPAPVCNRVVLEDDHVT